MRNFLFSTIIIAYSLFMAGCAGNATNRNAHQEHSHEGHDHSHESHDHEGHNHNHEHDDAGHDHDHSEHDHECEGHDHQATEQEHGDEIIFPAWQAARVGLEVEVAELSAFYGVIPASGDLSSAQGDAQVVVAPVSGVVLFPTAAIAQGRAVAKGEVMFYISSSRIAGGDEAARAKATYEAAKAAWERAEALLPDKIISQKEYDTARLEYLNAKGAWEALASGNSDRGSAVTASAAGYISSVAVTEGQFVEVGQPLATVERNARMRLTAQVPQRYYRQLADIRSANIVAPDGAVIELAAHGGRLVSVGRSLEAGSTTLPVTFEFTTNPSLIAGSTVEVYLLGTSRENVLTLPVDAITESQGLYFVYEKVDAEGYLRHEVQLGSSDGERVEITSGIKQGMKIVTRGAVHVKMATSSAIPHSHQH
jgi:RND family efflux transporter MFP subunit